MDKPHFNGSRRNLYLQIIQFDKYIIEKEKREEQKSETTYEHFNK